MVNVHHRGDTSAPFWTHVAGDRHIAAGASVDIRDVEDVGSLFALDHWREWHEFRTCQPFVQEVVRFPPGRIDGVVSSTKCTGAELHPVGINGADRALFQTRRSTSR